MWKPGVGSRPSVSQETERENLLKSPSLSTENSSISSDLGNLRLSKGGSEADESFSGIGSPTKETPTSLSGKDSKKGGNGERQVMIEVKPGGAFKPPVKPKHGHDRRKVSLMIKIIS